MARHVHAGIKHESMNRWVCSEGFRVGRQKALEAIKELVAPSDHDVVSNLLDEYVYIGLEEKCRQLSHKMNCFYRLRAKVILVCKIILGQRFYFLSKGLIVRRFGRISSVANKCDFLRLMDFLRG